MREAITNSLGRYTIDSLPTGKYRIETHFAGFETKVSAISVRTSCEVLHLHRRIRETAPTGRSDREVHHRRTRWVWAADRIRRCDPTLPVWIRSPGFLPSALQLCSRGTRQTARRLHLRVRVNCEQRKPNPDNRIPNSENGLLLEQDLARAAASRAWSSAPCAFAAPSTSAPASRTRSKRVGLDVEGDEIQRRALGLGTAVDRAPRRARDRSRRCSRRR